MKENKTEHLNTKALCISLQPIYATRILFNFAYHSSIYNFPFMQNLIANSQEFQSPYTLKNNQINKMPMPATFFFYIFICHGKVLMAL